MRKLVALAFSAGGLCLPALSQSFDPPVAVDFDLALDVVEVHLEAKEVQWQYFPITNPTETTTVWAYGDQATGVFTVPGPTIEAEVGDTVRVVFTNNLPEETTIHWHGNEAPATMDGAHISQRLIQPGETFTYEFPALNDAFYWYHPHVRPFDGVEKGLYGGLLFRDSAREALLGLDQMVEHLVFFDDIMLDTDLEVVPAFSMSDPLRNAEYHVNGREGNWLLVNGREAGNVELAVPNGVPQRWRMVNAANTAFARLDVQDAVNGFGFDVSLWEIGMDAGLIETPRRARWPVASTAPPLPEHPLQAQTGKQLSTGILMLPGQRQDQVFTPSGTDGQVFQVYQWDWFRGRHVADYDTFGTIVLMDDPLDGNYPTKDYFTVKVEGAHPGTEEWSPPASWSDVVQVPPMPPAAVGTIPVVFGHGDPDPNGNVTLFAQAVMAGTTLVTPLPTKKIDSFNAHDVNMGEVWDWEIVNLTHGDHPFHAHGFFFEFIEWEWEDDLLPGEPSLNFNFTTTRRWLRDTIRVPARLGAKGSSRTYTRLRVHFDDTGREGQATASGMLPTFRPDGTWSSGGWLYHCHVLEHSAKGMLSVLEVHDPDEIFTLLGKQTPGTGGLFPSLTATGDLSPGSDVVFDLVDARPNKKVFLVIGDYAARRQLTAGELVPGTSGLGVGLPFLGVMSGNSGAGGTFTWNLDEWNALPSGMDLYVQAAVRDPDAAGRLAFSNAMVFTVP